MTESDPLADQHEARIAQLRDWLAGNDVPIRCHLPSLRPASSDASFRRYFRIDTESDGTLIVMDAPPPQEDCAPFVRIAEMLAGAGVRVPEVLAHNLKCGFVLLSDLGRHTLLDDLQAHPDHADSHYRLAIGELVKMQSSDLGAGLPAYDRARLLAEMQLFEQWYVATHMRFRLSTSQQSELQRTFEAILTANLREPRVFVHRDFHSRNLMLAPAGLGPGVLDFQDAVFGPVSYDLVSLLRDAYIKWPDEQVLDWSIRYWEAARSAGIPVPADFSDFWINFDLMGIQRHLKVLGIFCRLHYRDGKSHYLDDLPLVLHYTTTVAQRYQVLQPLARLLERLQDSQPAAAGH